MKLPSVVLGVAHSCREDSRTPGRTPAPNLGAFYSSTRLGVPESSLRTRLRWAVPSLWMISRLPRHPSGMVGKLLDHLPSEIQGHRWAASRTVGQNDADPKLRGL